MINVYSVKSDGAKFISANFRVREFKCSDGSDIVFVDDALVKLLQAIRTHFGKAVKITSGYRTVSYNAKVSGSSSNSQHCYGRAADIKVTGVKPSEVYAFADAYLGNSGGVGLYSTFVHVDSRSVKSRWKE